jgi:uncharacterized protein
MPAITFLIKPASSNCNLRCKYCFYHSVSENRDVASYGIMKEDTLEDIVKKGLEYADDFCTFAFQGGEPTITGLSFFEKLIEFEKKHNVKNVKINNALQTNGMFIDENWAKFLRNNNFLVGLSLDGPKEIHDMNRIDAIQSGTFNRVMKTVALFNKYKVEYNILCVVTSLTARHITKIYNFYRQNNFKYLQFISCLDPLNELQGQHPYSLKPKDYEEFLKISFDRWYEDVMKGEYVSIRYFDNLVSMMLGHRPEACNMNGRCTCQFVIEADGGVYPCDFYVLDQWKIGNIRDELIKEIMCNENGKKFVQDSLSITNECRECKWYGMCRGGCRRERQNFQIGELSQNYYCSSYKEFFNYAYPRLLNVAKRFSQNIR